MNAVDSCAPDDHAASAGSATATFRKGKSTGTINVVASRAGYEKVMATINFQGFQLATSEEKLVIVFWRTTGSEVDDGLIRMGVMSL